MRHSRFSLFYLAGYLFPTGLGLLFAPGLVFKILQSTGSYGDVIPRMTGGLALALGILVVQIIRYRLDVLYPSIVGVRVVLCGILIGLYLYAHDPFFLIVTGVVALGMIWTAISLVLDRTPQGAPAR
jgi:hypothetical protein